MGMDYEHGFNYLLVNSGFKEYTADEIEHSKNERPYLFELAEVVDHTIAETGDYTNGFEAGVAIINRWGILEEDGEDVTYNEALNLIEDVLGYPRNLLQHSEPTVEELASAIKECVRVEEHDIFRLGAVYAGLAVLYHYRRWEKDDQKKKEKE